jgi:hypothetical protein
VKAPRRSRRAATVLFALALAVAGCGSPDAPTSQLPDQKSSASPGRTPSPSAAPVTKEVTAAQWQRMVEAGMWREGCPATRETLRRVEINHWDFDGVIQRGTLVVHEDVAASISRIFTRLFEAKFPIALMQGLEAYDGDNNASLRANNTAAYNCRRANQINAPLKESPHANGRAVDINPVQNPWQDLRCKCWSPGAEHAERVPGKGVIVEKGLVWQAFIDEGWVWQDIKVPDYMHFDTGYPSAPFTGATARP